MLKERFSQLSKLLSQENSIQAEMVRIAHDDSKALAEIADKEDRQAFKNHPEIRFLYKLTNDSEFQATIAKLRALCRMPQLKHFFSNDYVWLQIDNPVYPDQQWLGIQIVWSSHQGDDRADETNHTVTIDISCSENQKLQDGTVLVDANIVVRSGVYVDRKRAPVRSFSSIAEFAEAVTTCVATQSFDPLLKPA